MSKTFQNNNNSNNYNTKSNKNNINNLNNNTKANGVTQACAACKYQRRKCASDCLLAPYFPHHLHHQFLNAHKLFGVSNITKILRTLTPQEKDEAMNTIKYESDIRASDPVGGAYRIICHLERQIEIAYAELELVMQQLAIFRTATADTVSLLGDVDPQSQAQAIGPESEDVIIHCDNIINNDIEDHESNAYKAADESISPIHQHAQPQCQTEDDNGVTIECDVVVNNNNIDDQIYRHDSRNLDENNGKEDVRIDQYFLEGDNEINEENNNVVLSWQDMEASWALQDAWTFCLDDKEGFANECGDLKPNVVDNIGAESLGGPKYCNDELTILEPSDEGIPKDNETILQEKIVSCTSIDEKLILREDEESHDIRRAATL